MSIRQVQVLWRQRISSWEASWVAARPGMLALALGSQVLDHLALPHQTWPNWVEQTLSWRKAKRPLLMQL
jgi:hypothetical protein